MTYVYMYAYMSNYNYYECLFDGRWPGALFGFGNCSIGTSSRGYSDDNITDSHERKDVILLLLRIKQYLLHAPVSPPPAEK